MSRADRPHVALWRVIVVCLVAVYGLWAAFTREPSATSLWVPAILFFVYAIFTVAVWWTQGREEPSWLRWWRNPFGLTGRTRVIVYVGLALLSFLVGMVWSLRQPYVVPPSRVIAPERE